VVDEIMRTLDDPALRTSPTWWHYFFVVTALGAKDARRVARDVRGVEAKGGMNTQDGLRRRTPGGVFFALAKERLGPEKMKLARRCAERCSEEELLKRFLRFLATVLSASAPRLAVDADHLRPRRPPSSAPRAPAAADTGTSPVRSRAAALEPAALPDTHTKTRAPLPASSPRPAPNVEVVVVRRRSV
jgi:PHAX RNA-binding domain